MTQQFITLAKAALSLAGYTNPNEVIHVIDTLYVDVDEDIDVISAKKADDIISIFKHAVKYGGPEIEEIEGPSFEDNAEYVTTYRIFHPVQMEGEQTNMNPNCLTDIVFKEVFSIMDGGVDTLNAAYKAAQSHDDQYATMGIRSTCIGDVIKEDGEFFMVMPVGFKSLPFIKIGG